MTSMLTNRRITAFLVILAAMGTGLAPIASAEAQTATVQTKSGRGYAFLLDDDFGHPARWNPCKPLTYTLYGKAAKQHRQEFNYGIAKASAASGVRFTRVASNPMIRIHVFHRSGNYSNGWVDVEGANSAAGQRQSLRAGRMTLVFGGRTSRLIKRQIVMHEFGHVLGLAHVRSKRELMYPTAGHRKSATYAAGDLAGLRRVGRSAGCLNPPPAPTNVQVTADRIEFGSRFVAITWNAAASGEWPTIGYTIKIANARHVEQDSKTIEGDVTGAEGIWIPPCTGTTMITVQRNSLANSSSSTVPLPC